MDRWIARREARREREKRLIQRIWRLLRRGWSLRQVAALPDMPSLRTLRYWVVHNHLALGTLYKDELGERLKRELQQAVLWCNVLDATKLVLVGEADQATMDLEKLHHPAVRR